MVGIVELGYSLQDNEHLADLGVTVRPDHRRQGIVSSVDTPKRRLGAGRPDAPARAVSSTWSTTRDRSPSRGPREPSR